MTSIISSPARRRRLVRAALLSATAGFAATGASPAVAQCVVQPGGTATCAGENTTEQSVGNGGSITVTTEAGFAVDSPGNGLVISGPGSLTYDDANASTIIGRGRDGIAVGNGGGASRIVIRTGGDITGLGRAGIITNNAGTGGVLVEATGTVTGASTGITVVNLLGSNGDIEILSNNAAGGTSGIGAENRGGSGAIRITSTGTASATDSEGFAIVGFQSVPGAGGDIVIDANDIGGVGGGINVSNLGAGSIDITVNGTVDVAGRQGISAGNGVTAKDLIVTAKGSVTAGATAISVSNQGSGRTVVTAEGQLLSNNVRSQESDVSGNGLNIVTGSNAGDVIANVAGVEGRAGILVRNLGQGSVSLTATGPVEGRDGRGVEILGGSASGAFDVDLAAVTGATDGVTIAVQGNSPVDLSISGPVVAALDGVRVQQSASGVGDINVAVGAVTATQSGVIVTASGVGDVTLAATGTLTGTEVAGLIVFGRGAIDVDVVDVTGLNGVFVTTSGSEASVDFASTGTLAATEGDGLFVSTTGTGRIDVLNSIGARNGVTLTNGGGGEAVLISRGTATGGVHGIRAVTSTGSLGSLSLDVNNASGGDYGVSITTRGFGGGGGEGGFEPLRVAAAAAAAASPGGAVLVTRGTVEGGIAGIDASTETGQAFSLTNEGVIRNASGASADLAIQALGGPVDILNNSTLLGTIRLDAGIVAPEPEPEPEPKPEDPGDNAARVAARSAFVIAEVPDIEASHRLTNAGTWNSIGGVNVFGGVDDVLVNVAGGRLIGGTSAALAETTSYSGLETLTNQGTITMVDGGIGDIVQTSGDASFAAGSVLAVDAGGSGSDRFVAGGATTIEAGARLQVSNPQPAVLGTRYTVLESAGGVTGSFTFADQLLSNFLGYRQGRTDTTIFIELAKLRVFAAAGVTPNQIAVGTALDGQAATDPLAAAVLLLPSDAAAQAAFDGLSGEIHPSLRTTMIEDSRLPRNAVLERLDARTGGAVWGQMFGNWGDSDGVNGTADLDRETIGGVLGADFAVGDSAMIGVAGSYLETDVDVRARSSSAKLKSWHVLGYAGVEFGGAALKVGGGYASASIDTDRSVAFPGIGQRLVADYDGSVIHGFADLAYRLPLGGGHVEPFAQIVAVRADTDAFAETGGSAAVAGAKADENATLSTLGARFSTAMSGAVSVGGTVGWQHGYGDLTPATAMRFATGPGFAAIGTPRSRNAGIATIDARLRLSDAAQITVSYDGVIGSAGQDHSIKAGLRIAF